MAVFAKVIDNPQNTQYEEPIYSLVDYFLALISAELQRLVIHK
jgi:hypothetical protein